MLPTRKLFYDDASLTRFSARVLRCTERAGRFAVLLDQTCFYPEGGGQPADRGLLDGAKVLDVFETGGVIEHITDAPLPEGRTVEGWIDWGRRLSMMQHHTAEHIVSGLALRLYALHNVGFHMGDSMVTIDLDGPLEKEQIDNLELLSNRTVFKNIPVLQEFPDDRALQTRSFRSKGALSGDLRLITVPDVDCCACCGTHVARTGEIGLIKLLSPQRHKGGLRLGLVCGERALLDYRGKEESTGSISSLLSVPQAQVADAVRRLLEEQADLRGATVRAREALFSARCDAAGEGTQPLCLFEDSLSPVELRRFCRMLTGRRTGICAVFSGEDGHGYRYALGSQAGDMRLLSRALQAALGGKGGGSAALAQGVVGADRGDIERFFASLKEQPHA